MAGKKKEQPTWEQLTPYERYRCSRLFEIILSINRRRRREAAAKGTEK